MCVCVYGMIRFAIKLHFSFFSDNPQQQQGHKFPKISFSDNSSSIIQCISNDRATFFVKIDFEENESDITPLRFEWSRGDVPIKNSDRFRITQTSNAVQLAIEHVTTEDAGHYTLCARTKGNDVIRKDVELVIEDKSTGDDPPIFLRRLVDLSVKVGTRTRLLVEIRSSTDVKLTWYRKYRRICENDRVKEINEGSFHYLEISPVILEDGGQWMVHAENLNGRNSCICHLNILVPKAYKVPEFIEELKAVLTQQGTVALECKVVGVPTPQLRWFKDSKEIKAGDIFALTANADDPTSLGTYTCEAVNCMGKTYSSSKVHVVGRGSREDSLKSADSLPSAGPPPIFTSELRDTSVKIGDTLILGCQVVVPPWPKNVVWYNKNGRVDIDERYKLIEDGLGVYMAEVKPSASCDEGEWKCVVTNDDGAVGISTCLVNMEIPKNYRKPRFMETLRAVLTDEGLVSFECKVVGFPAPILKWFKDGQELKPGDVYQLTGTNSLGTYCCIAKNCMGETSSMAVLTIEDIQNQLSEEERLVFANKNQPPKFLLGLKSQEAKINEAFQFTVKIEATPDPLLTWFRDELPIQSNERYNHYRGDRQYWHLDVRCLEIVDQAEWKCVVVNDFGTSVTSCFLKLQVPRHYKKPRFLECLRAVLTEEGAVNLECKVIGVPQPVLKWYKDGVELKPGDIHKIISGQDGTCCLGTYTCEARNCMGVMASSASLLGFEDDYSKQDCGKQHELQRNFSLSTIQEERTSQLYETPAGDITITERGDVSFSLEGKEVSVSLYETPDLTEEEALKIVEMYADQLSEHVTEQNIVELPPLRFVKETAQSGKLLMEATVIDISPEYFTHEEDLRTEAGMSDISINELTVHGFSAQELNNLDRETEDYAKKSFEKMEEELSLTTPDRKRKKSKATETEEFFSLSKATMSPNQNHEDEEADDSSELQTFASARMELGKEDVGEQPLKKKSRKSDSDSSKTNETETKLIDISGAVGDGLMVLPDKLAKKVITNEQEIADNVRRLLPLAKMLKILDAHMCAVEAEVISQSVMMMTASSADQSIAIIKNIGEPLQQIQSKLKVYSGETPIESLFETMKEDIRCLHVGLQVVEKCVEIDERGTTLIQRTSVCIIDSLADHIIKTLDELRTIANSFEGDSLKSHLLLTTDDIRQGLEITKGTIKSQALLQEAQELEANKHFTEAVAKLQELPEPLPFEKVPQVDLPPQAESVKLICQPVWEIQQALEKVENELSLEETDDGIYCKVHQKIVDNFLEPFQHLQQVLQVIEQRAETLTGTEQKINLAILDIVTPPLFELKKGLEVINAQPSNDVEGGKLTVNTVESMVPPLQEIQNGLAQLSQDVLTGGQVTEDLALDSEEVNKLLQSLAQAVLHLESNIEQIPCKIPQQIPVKLLTLKEHISTLIEQIVTQGVNKFHIILLGNIKRPIDELNYCMRQIEQKSITGSLGDLVDPLRSLDAKIKQSKDILCILPVNARDDLLGILHDVQQLLKTIEIDIDEYEFRMQQKEIESERQESAADQLQETMEWRFVQEKYSKQLQKLTKIIREVSKLEFIDNKLRAAFNDLIPPCGKIIVELRNMPDCQVFAQNIVRRTADSILKINACLLQLGETTNKSQCNNLLNSVVRNYFQELKLAIDQSEDQTATVQTLQLAEAFNNMLNIVENIVQLCGEDAIDDLSTLEDVSALKSNAESLPVENSVTWKTATLEERRVQAEQLLGQLKQDIGTVLAHCSEFDLGCVQTETMQEVKAAVEKIHDFKECLQNTLSMNVMEYSPTGSDLRTMAEAVYSLESCALQIHEHLEQGIVTDTSDLEVNELRTIAEPLQELVHAVKVFYTQEFDQVSSIGTLTQISMTSASVMQSLKPFVLSVHENHAIETLESIANQISLTHLKQFVQPLHELEKALIMQEDNTCLSQIVALPEQKQQDLRAWAKPLLCLKGSIVQVKEELALSTLEECPEFKVIAQKSPVLFNLLKYCETLNADFLEQFEELSSENLSILKTYAEPQIVRSIDEKLIIKEMPQIEIFDMRKCVTESIQLLSKALLKTAAIQTAEVYELNLITERLRTDLQTLSKQKETESVEFIQLRNCLAKTMFKLKECLVHTYEADVEVAVEDIEKIFEDLLQVIPNLEKQLALEMKEKIALSCSEFITVIHQSEYESLLLLAEPIRNLLDSLILLSDHNEVDIEKSSPLFQKIQMQLVRIVQIINNGDCLIEFCQDLKPALLNLANNLNSIKDFLEKNDGNIRVIELLQELDYFATDLKEVSCSLENNNRKNYLIQETSATKSFLMALEQGLTENNPLVHIFLEKHYEDVQQLEAALKTVECDIIPRVERSQMIWLAEELESIEAIGKLLGNLQENMKILSQELVELPKDKAVFTAEMAEEISETKRQPLPEAERQDTIEFIKIPIVEECVNFIFKALKEDKHLQILEADMQEALSSKDDNRRTESIFRIREHIVHTYDSGVNKHLENLIDSLLECNPNLLELINARYCLAIKENIEPLQADIKALANEPCQSKLCSVHEKLLNLAEISDRLKPYRDIENSSQKIVELQKYLMEIFCTFDDLLEISDDDLTPAIEIVKALALRQYDENENSKAGIKTAKVFEDILHLCAELKVTVEKVKVKLADSASIRQIPEAAETKSKAAAPDLKAREIEEKQSEVMIKKIDKKETVAKELRGEFSEITAEKVEKKVIDSTVKTIEKKKIEEMQLKAEVSEVTAEKIEKQAVSVDAKKLEHMAVEATKIKGKVSEVKLADSASIRQIPEAAETKSKAAAPDLKAREIEEKQSEVMIKKIDKKETVAKPLRPEVSEIKAEKVEKKVIDSTVKTIAQKKIEEMKLKAEVSEVTPEKIEKQEVSVDVKKVRHMAVEATEMKGKATEVKAEKIEEKQSEVVVKEVDKKEIKAKELNSEIKADKVEGKMIESTVKTIELENIKEMKLKAEVFEIVPEKNKEEGVSVEAKKVEHTRVEAINSEAKVRQVEEENIEEKQLEKVKGNKYKENKEMRNAKRPPRVDVKLTNRNSSVGSDIKLTCSILGNDLQILWFKENKRLENNSKYKILFMDGLSCLEIKSADCNDAAIYRCVANNRNGEVETSCLVTIYDVPTNKFGTPPIFTRNIREGETTAADAPSEDRESVPPQDTLQVPTQKRRKLKSPTPLRGRSATPIHGRSQTPFSLYMIRRSATPSTWRSITPFLKREEKEKTPFELGRDILTQITCNKAVFDRALIMDISEPEETQKPVRYITSDMSVIDRAAVMDVSNVEVIYVVEEYEEYEEEEEVKEEVKPKKKGKGKKGRVGRKSADKEQSPGGGGEGETGEGGDEGSRERSEDREESADFDEFDEPSKKGKKKGGAKKKEKKEKSPSPKLTLKLEIGGGQKASKKMFEDKDKQSQDQKATAKPPPKKSKLVLQMEEQAKAAAKAAEDAAKQTSKPKSETFEERQKRLKAEKEEQERLEAEQRALEEELRAQQEAELAEDDEEEGGEEGDSDAEGEDASSRYEEDGGESRYDSSRYEDEEAEEADEVGDLPGDARRGSDESEGFTRPDPYDEERWQQIAEEEGEEFMQQLRKYSLAIRKSEKQRDEEWQRRREQLRLPHFVVFLSDRTVEAGQKVRLTCAIGGPELSVKWFKDGRQLERDATHRIINNNNIIILEVINTTILDSGEYSCVIANMNDEVTSSCFVTIYEVFKDEPAPPTFKLVKEYYHLRDDELTIEMHIHGVPRPVVTWWRGSFEVKPNFKFTRLEEAHGVYKLLIYKPNNRDSGTYTCKAINSCGEAQMRHTIEVAKNLNYHVHGIFHARDRLQQDKEKTAKKAMEEAMKSKEASDKKRAVVEVAPRAARSSPEPLVSPKQKLKFATQLRDRMSLEGSTVKFICNVIGPNPTCRWMKDDNAVKFSENVKNFSEEGKPILELRNVTADSSGVYKCIAKNDYSEIETSCYFKVYAAQAEGDESEPIFALPLRDVYHSSQNDLVLDTKVRGNPRPSITWLKDRVPVVLDGRIVQIEHLDGICELIINKPTPSDNGTYICVAQNKLGTQEAQHSVVVDVVQTSRRSSTQSAIMSDSSDSKSKGERPSKVPKGKKKEDEGEAVAYERRSKMPEVNPKQQLYFNAIVSNRYVTEGSKVKLQAVVMGPNPAMKWMKDDQNVTYGPRIRNMSRDCLASLEFVKALPEDSGLYTLVAQNEFCKISTSAKLLVYSTNVSAEVEPVFTRPLRDTYHLNTNELILETGVRGQPAPKVQWFKDSVEIEKSERFHIFNHSDGTCELVIDYPSNKDSGKYTVKAESSAGKAEITHLVTFAGKDHHIADNIHGVFHADKNLLKAKLAELELPKEQKHPEVSESEGEEGKGKGKSKGKARGKKDEEEEVALPTADTPTSDTLKKREKVIGIHFPTTVKDRVVAEGSKVKISCFLAAKEPQVKWFKNEEQIQNSAKIRGRYVEGLCTLEITSATEEDSGEYKCWARDETGEASTFCRLKVYADPGSADVPPTFTRNIKETYHPKINELQLECHVRGSPTATVTWVKDGVKIEQSDKYQQIDHNDGKCELVVSEPVQADSGKYVCQAENRAGKAEITHKVTVEARRVRAPSPRKEGVVGYKSSAEETDEEEKEKKKAKKKKDDEEEGGGRRREVLPPPDMKKRVYLRNFLSNRTVKEGSNVKWVVNIDGPEPTARWFHGENPIAFGPKSKMNLQDGIAWLQLVKVTEEDSGEYLVKVKGPENEVVSTCNLFVYSTGKEELVAPVFTVGIKDVFNSDQHLLTIECKVTGRPKPKICWQKDSTLLLQDSNKYTYVEMEDDMQQLMIRNPTDSDTGLYTCYAESESGQMKISKFIDISDYRLKEKTLPSAKTEKLLATNAEQSQSNMNHILALKDQAKDAQFKLRLQTPMKSMKIAAGCKAQLMCSISGFIEDVYWLRDEERILKDGRHKIYNINNNLSLEIYEARTDDSGQYKCMIRNSRNTVECQCQLHVYDSTSGFLPASFSQPMTIHYDGERGELFLACHVHGRQNVTWLRDDHSILNNRYRIVEEAGGVSKLIIRNPIHTDCGSFSCFVETNESIESITKDVRISELKSLMSSSTEMVESGLMSDFKPAKEMITATSKKSLLNHLIKSKRKPLFNTLLHDRNVIEGSNLRLSCNLLCDDNTKVEWLKDMKPLLSEDKRFQTCFTVKGEVILEIFTTEESDSGQYVCRATNDYGEMSTQAYIRIYKPYVDALKPSVFVQSIRDNYSLNDNELVLDCRVRGKPRPEIQWMKGTDYIIPGEKYTQVNEDDGYTKIIVHNPTEKDSGLYACVARNEAGENKLTHHVEFVGRERFTLQKTHGFFHRDPNKPHLVCPLGDQTVHKGGTIAISAEFMQTQSPIDVQWLLNRQALSGHPNVKTFHDHGIYTLAIIDATPECEGTYTCKAQNAFGRIESHAHVDISQGATKEERPPLFLSRPENEMKIAVGDPFSISFRIAGDPKPKRKYLSLFFLDELTPYTFTFSSVSFLKGTKDITKSDRVSKEVSDDYTRFTVQKSQISDSGTYFVVARNDNGTDRLFVTIEVKTPKKKD
uniref:Ig-like domain-containing protein n=1 Tax=Glossina palpalis gambiensis TaxID=67801 RepID=A0A1B0BT08_9MUSC